MHGLLLPCLNFHTTPHPLESGSCGDPSSSTDLVGRMSPKFLRAGGSTSPSRPPARTTAGITARKAPCCSKWKYDRKLDFSKLFDRNSQSQIPIGWCSTYHSLAYASILHPFQNRAQHVLTYFSPASIGDLFVTGEHSSAALLDTTISWDIHPATLPAKRTFPPKSHSERAAQRKIQRLLIA